MNPLEIMRERRAAKKAELDALLAAPTDEKRDLTEDEDTQFGKLVTEIRGQDERIAEQTDKISEVSRKMDRAGRTLNAAIAYIERLLDFISAQLPEHPNVPPMPAEVRQQMHEH